MTDNGYFVFGFGPDGKVTELYGTIREPYEDNEESGWYGTDEIVDLPRAFMLGGRWAARVYRNKRPGSPVLAVIPIGSRPVSI